MSEELTTPPNFMDNIRDKIKNSFVELVPDETWDAMVQQEIDNFFKSPTTFKIRTETNGGWGASRSESHHFEFEGETKPTMFRAIVWEMCAQKTKEHLDSEYIQNVISIALEERKDEATGETTNLIQQAVPLMVNKYFESIAINMTNQMADMIRHNINNGGYQHP